MSSVDTSVPQLAIKRLVTCPHCGFGHSLNRKQWARQKAMYVAKYGRAALYGAAAPTSGSGGRPAVQKGAVPNPNRTPPPAPAPPATETPSAPPAPPTPPATETPPTPQHSQLREDGIWQLDPLLGPRRLRGTGAAHWLRLGMGGRNPLHAGRFDARGAAYQLHQGARDLALVPSEHGLAFFVVEGLAEGSGDRDELFRRADEVAQCHGALPAYERDPVTGARREKPLLAFACSNSGRGRSEVVVESLHGYWVERHPLKVVDVETWRRALPGRTLRPMRERYITEKLRSPTPAPETVAEALEEFRSWFLHLPDDWLRRAPPGTRREVGWLANAEIWAEFERAFEAWGLPLDGWNPTKLALAMRNAMHRDSLPFGKSKMLGSGNAKRRGRYQLAWRGDPESLLLRP